MVEVLEELWVFPTGLKYAARIDLVMKQAQTLNINTIVQSYSKRQKIIIGVACR
eukprot:SAG11_NODE_26724_length_341_cov_1.276860_1_plen_53_part_10